VQIPPGITRLLLPFPEKMGKATLQFPAVIPSYTRRLVDNTTPSSTEAYTCSLAPSFEVLFSTAVVCLVSSAPSNKKNVGSSHECCFIFSSALLGDDAAVGLVLLLSHTNQSLNRNKIVS
jgi:hypothetical protein